MNEIFGSGEISEMMLVFFFILVFSILLWKLISILTYTENFNEYRNNKKCNIQVLGEINEEARLLYISLVSFYRKNDISDFKYEKNRYDRAILTDTDDEFFVTNQIKEEYIELLDTIGFIEYNEGKIKLLEILDCKFLKNQYEVVVGGGYPVNGRPYSKVFEVEAYSSASAKNKAKLQAFREEPFRLSRKGVLESLEDNDEGWEELKVLKISTRELPTENK